MALLFTTAPTKADIDRLVAAQERESISLDYKESLALGSDAEKKEFLADVASFANTRGGNVIYGVTESRENGKATGLPAEALGVAGINADQMIRQMEAVIASGLAPRVPGVRVHPVDGFPNGPVLVLHIPRSWAGPHMLHPPQSSRFFGRTSAGKYPLDVQEIRAAFAAGDEVPARVRSFRRERLALIASGEGPIVLDGDRTLALHIVPVASVEARTGYDVSIVGEGRGPHHLRPMFSDGWNRRYNLDGVCTWSAPHGTAKPTSYAQLFRSGVIEAVAVPLVGRDDRGHSTLFAADIENEILHCTRDCLALFASLGVEAPVVVAVSLLGMKHLRIPTPSLFPVNVEKYRIDRDELLLPDVWLDDFGADLTQSLRPIFDALWQSAGFPGSLSYGPDGARK